MGAISKELLSMMYNRVSELQFDNKVTYWCADGKKCDVLIFYNKDTDEIVQYEDMCKYTTRKNIGFIEFRDKAVIIDLNTLQEIKRYENILKCEYIYDTAVAIPMKNRIIVYSLIENKELFNEECICTNNRSDRAEGRIYDFISFGKSSIVVKRDGTVGKLFRTAKARHIAEANKRTYCDIVVQELSVKNTGYLDNTNYFVCGKNIYTTEEYLKEITVKSIKEDLFTSDINGLQQEGIAGYNVILNNGNKGYLASNLRRMTIGKKSKNILNDDFEYYKKTYLV